MSEDQLNSLDSATHRLHSAIKAKNLELVSNIITEYRQSGGDVKKLLNHGIYDSWMGSSLCMAVRHWHTQHCACEDHFVNSNANPNPCGIFVAHPTTNAIVELLLENGADPLVKDYYDDNAIQLATMTGKYFSDPAPETLAVFRKFGYQC